MVSSLQSTLPVWVGVCRVLCKVCKTKGRKRGGKEREKEVGSTEKEEKEKENEGGGGEG